MGVRAMVFLLGSVAIDNFDIQWTGRIGRPLETETPSIVYPNGILPTAISSQGFQPVGIEQTEIQKRLGCGKNAQALLGLPPKRLPLAYSVAGGKTLGVPISITLDHEPSAKHYRRLTSNVH